MITIFGKGSNKELFPAPNGLLITKTAEDHLDRGNIVIVSDVREEATVEEIKQWNQGKLHDVSYQLLLKFVTPCMSKSIVVQSVVTCTFKPPLLDPIYDRVTHLPTQFEASGSVLHLVSRSTPLPQALPKDGEGERNLAVHSHIFVNVLSTFRRARVAKQAQVDLALLEGNFGTKIYLHITQQRVRHYYI